MLTKQAAIDVIARHGAMQAIQVAHLLGADIDEVYGALVSLEASEMLRIRTEGERLRLWELTDRCERLQAQRIVDYAYGSTAHRCDSALTDPPPPTNPTN